MSGIKILVLFLPLLFLDEAHLKPDGFRKPQPGKPWVPPMSSLDDKIKPKQSDPGRSFDLLYQTPPPPFNQWPSQAPSTPGYNPWTTQAPSTPGYNPWTTPPTSAPGFNPWTRPATSTPEYNPWTTPAPTTPGYNPWTTPAPTTPDYNQWTTPAPSNRFNLPNDFRCPQAYGNFKYSNPCDEYIQCRNYIPLAYKCPAGLQFNRFALWTENPCDHPSKVQCYETPGVQTNRPLPPPPPPTTTAPAKIVPRDLWCPQPHGYFRQSEQCGSYVECQNAVPRTHTCPFGLHFNPSAQWPEYPCDYPSRVQCKGQPDIPATTTTTPPPPSTTSIIAPYPQFKVQPNYQCPQSNGFFRHNDQCGEYVECKNYIPRTYTCPDGLHFNPRVQWTDYPCENPSTVQCYKEPAKETTTTTTTTTPPPTTPAPTLITSRDFSCPQAHGYFKQSKQCGEYVECKNYVPRSYACPAGLHFNPNVEWTEYPCDHPSRVQCK